MTQWDNALLWLLSGLFGLLLVASLTGGIIARFKQNETVSNLHARIRAWWVMCIISVLAMLTGPVGSVVLFMLMSFFALRECITLLPTRRSDHETLFWCFFIILPLQYLLEPSNLRQVEITHRGRVRHVLEYGWPGQRIWGATAAILYNLRRRLEQVP